MTTEEEEEEIDLNRFSDKFSRSFECSLCLSFITDVDNIASAVEHIECENIFHTKCLKKCRDCPICRGSSKTGKTKRVNRIVREYHNQLRLSCKNSPQGCKETMALIDRKVHEEKCEYVMTLCEFGCKVMKRDLGYHMQYLCYKSCRYCFTRVKCSEIDMHMERDCDKNYVLCEAIECREKLLYKNKFSHIKECPEVQVWCDYFDLGCRVKMKRKFISEHVKNCDKSPEVSCDKCGCKIMRTELSSHKKANCCKKCNHCNKDVKLNNFDRHIAKDCVVRSVKCDICDEFTSHKDLVNHQSSCREEIVKCSKCRVNVKRKHMSSHLNNKCPRNNTNKNSNNNCKDDTKSSKRVRFHSPSPPPSPSPSLRSHDDDDSRSYDSASRSRSRSRSISPNQSRFNSNHNSPSAPPCRYYNIGNCRYGNRCRYQH
eukprot:gene12961-17376_t